MSWLDKKIEQQVQKGILQSQVKMCLSFHGHGPRDYIGKNLIYIKLCSNNDAISGQWYIP